MRVTIQRSQALGSADLAAVRAARLGPLLRRSGDALGVPARRALTLLLTDDLELQRLNRTFRSVDAPTDVLAFPAESVSYVGDIAISVERARAQADDGVAELRLLAIHGLLHCLGHDHVMRDQAQEMTTLTRALLPHQQVPDLEPSNGWS